MLRLELLVALAVKNWTGRRAGEKVEERRALMASDGGRIMLMVMLGLCPSMGGGFSMTVVELHVCGTFPARQVAACPTSARFGPQLVRALERCRVRGVGLVAVTLRCRCSWHRLH